MYYYDSYENMLEHELGDDSNFVPDIFKNIILYFSEKVNKYLSPYVLVDCSKKVSIEILFRDLCLELDGYENEFSVKIKTDEFNFNPNVEEVFYKLSNPSFKEAKKSIDNCLHQLYYNEFES